MSRPLFAGLAPDYSLFKASISVDNMHPRISPPFTHQIAGELTMTMFNSSTHPVPGLLYASTRSVSLSISCRAAELGRIFYQRNRMIYWVEKMEIYILYYIIVYYIIYYILYYIIL